MNDLYRHSPGRVGRSACGGVVLLALLMALVLAGIALMAAVDVASVARQRAREQELLYVGDQYRKAILRYYVAGPGTTRRTLPAKLEDLLDDDRFPMPVHHLRRLYPDPITGNTDWGLLRVGDRIAGVYSQSEKQPLKQAGFEPAYEQFDGRASYREWVFVVKIPGRVLQLPPPTGAPGVAPPDPPPPSRRTPS